VHAFFTTADEVARKVSAALLKYLFGQQQVSTWPQQLFKDFAN